MWAEWGPAGSALVAVGGKGRTVGTGIGIAGVATVVMGDGARGIGSSAVVFPLIRSANEVGRTRMMRATGQVGGFGWRRRSCCTSIAPFMMVLRRGSMSRSVIRRRDWGLPRDVGRDSFRMVL